MKHMQKVLADDDAGKRSPESLRITELERENARLRDGYLHLLGQVEQAREGFGIYHNSPTMEEAVKTARMILLPNVAVSRDHGDAAT
jgi:hypothetical protein